MFQERLAGYSVDCYVDLFIGYFVDFFIDCYVDYLVDYFINHFRSYGKLLGGSVAKVGFPKVTSKDIDNCMVALLLYLQ